MASNYKSMGGRWEVNWWLLVFGGISGIGNGFGLYQLIDSYLATFWVSFPIGMIIGIGTIRTMLFRVYDLAGQYNSLSIFKQYISDMSDPVILVITILGMWGNTSMFYAGSKYIDQQREAAAKIAEFNQTRYETEIERQNQKLNRIQSEQQNMLGTLVITRGYNISTAREDSLERVYAARRDSLANATIQSYATVSTHFDNFALMDDVETKTGTSRDVQIILLLIVMAFIFDGCARIAVRRRRTLDDWHNSENGLTPASGKNSTKTVNVNGKSPVNSVVNAPTVNEPVNGKSGGWLNRSQEKKIQEVIQRIKNRDPKILLIHQLLRDPSIKSQSKVAERAGVTPPWVTIVKQAYERIGASDV